METRKKLFRMTPARLIPISFLAAILIGTLLLLLPVCTAHDMHTDFLTALFTATTSVCVTGLVVVDTFSHWSTVGHAVILLLIQIGGLGIVAVLSFLALMFRRRFSLSGRALLQDAFGLDTHLGMIRFLRRVFLSTLIVEGTGAILYAFSFVPRYGMLRGLWISCFTAISAFCNAGIDLLGSDSLIPYQQDPAVLMTTVLMIVLGGLGYVVWFDLLDSNLTGMKKKLSLRMTLSRLGEHTKAVLVLTFGLILSGTVFFYLAERNNPDTLGNLPLADQLMGALFQSVTLRTAGFAAVPQGSLTPASTLVSLLLMFIGGSPIGTAGGVKTVTLFLVVLNAWSFIHSRDETIIFNRRVPEELMRRSAAIVTVSFGAVFLLSCLLLSVCPLDITDAVYEITSACATVGLTRGITASLNTAGRLVVILAMYLGRIGPISMVLFFSRSSVQENRIRHAAGRFYAG